MGSGPSLRLSRAESLNNFTQLCSNLALPGAGYWIPQPLVDIGGAFPARERKRIRSSSRLGAGGVERVERADGTWYVNPEPSGNAR